MGSMLLFILLSDSGEPKPKKLTAKHATSYPKGKNAKKTFLNLRALRGLCGSKTKNFNCKMLNKSGKTTSHQYQYRTFLHRIQ
jgi:hypothetical protein